MSSSLIGRLNSLRTSLEYFTFTLASNSNFQADNLYSSLNTGYTPPVIKQLTDQLAQIVSDYNILKNDYDNKLTVLTDADIEIWKALDDIGKQLLDFEESITTISSDLQNLTNSFNSLDSRVDNVETVNDNQDSAIDDLSRTVDNNDRLIRLDLAILTTIVEAKDQQINGLRTDHEVLADEFAYLKDTRLANAENRISSLESNQGTFAIKQTVDNTFTTQSDRITALENNTAGYALQLNVDTAFTDMDDRVVALEGLVPTYNAYNGRLNTLEDANYATTAYVDSANTLQNTRTTLLEGQTIILGNKVTLLQNEATNYALKDTVNPTLANHETRLTTIESSSTSSSATMNFILWRALRFAEMSTQYFGLIGTLNTTNFPFGGNLLSDAWTSFNFTQNVAKTLPIQALLTSHGYFFQSSSDIGINRSDFLVGLTTANSDGVQNALIEVNAYANSVFNSVKVINPYYTSNQLGLAEYSYMQLSNLTSPWTTYVRYTAKGRLRLSIQHNGTNSAVSYVAYVCAASFSRTAASTIINSSNYLTYAIARNMGTIQVQDTNEIVIDFVLSPQSVDTRWSLTYVLMFLDGSPSITIRNDSGFNIDFYLRRVLF